MNANAEPTLNITADPRVNVLVGVDPRPAERFLEQLAEANPRAIVCENPVSEKTNYYTGVIIESLARKHPRAVQNINDRVAECHARITAGSTPHPQDNALNLARHLAYESAALLHGRDWPQYHPDQDDTPFTVVLPNPETGLHPDRQRRLIPALTHTFPGMQLFTFTQSPFVVAGLKAGQLHRIHRSNQDDAVNTVVTTNDRDIIGWTIDEIMRAFMDMFDPTDAATAAATAELRTLRQLPQPQDPVKAQAHQDRIDELQQTVSREIEAGGPVALQRQIFETQFAQALEKHAAAQ